MIRTSRAAKAFGAIALASVLALTACGSDDSAGKSATGEKGDPIKIGVVNSAEESWNLFTKAAEAEGIEVELVNFSDYPLINESLANGDLDLNEFQHLQYLAKNNVGTGQDLTPIGATAVFPLGLYSTKHESIEDIPAGAEIAIPNDDTNQARALLVLQEAGLISLVDGGSAFSTTADIIADESTVKVTAVDAAQTAAALPDIDGAVINNDYVTSSGLTADDRLYADDPDASAAEPYINIWVSRAADADNATYLKLVEIYHSAEVEAAALEESGGTAVFKNNSAADLQTILDGIVADFKATS